MMDLKRYNLSLTERQINEICHALNILARDQPIKKHIRYTEGVHSSICKQLYREQRTGKKPHRKTGKLAILFALLLSTTIARAESDSQLVHDTAHLGAGYAINTVSYGLAKSAFRMEPYDARIFAGTASALVGLSYNGLSALTTRTSFNTRGMIFTGLGIGLSTLTTWSFDF